MALVETVKAIARAQVRELAGTINGELKAECPKRTGRAAGAIHIEQTGDTSYRIGGTDDHLFFADQGNNQSRSVIYPVRRKVLKFTDGSFHHSASTYEGKHFVEEVANRHR